MDIIRKIKGIIFDMDNTLLRSRIDFYAMKRAVFDLLVAHKFYDENFDYRNHTTSQLIEEVRRSQDMTREFEKLIWDTVAQIEKKGMEGADLEPWVPEVLKDLRDRYNLVVFTNNAQVAAETALNDTGITQYFDRIVGREQVEALKPNPAGIHYILSQYRDIPADCWLSIGDSWIDGKASQDGGVHFITYRGDISEMHQRDVYPLTSIKDMRELLKVLGTC